MAGIPLHITPLSYIRGTGSQYIETEIYLRSTDVVRSKWRFENSAGNVYGCFTSSSGTDNFCLYAGSSSTDAYIRYNGQLVRDFRPANGSIHELEQGPGGFFDNGTKLTDFTPATFTCSAPMYIFMLPNSTSAKVTARCYGLTIFRDGDQAYNFIPARNELTGEVGFYESVQGVFYENDGTGVFGEGPEVSFSVKSLLLMRRRGLLGAAKHYEIPPASDGYTWCYYDVNDTENATKLLNANSGIANTMIVDGTSVARSNTYLFQTTGIHLVKFKFNTVGGSTQYFASCPRLIRCYLNIDFLPYRMFRNSANLVDVGVDYITSTRTEGGQFQGCSSVTKLSFKAAVNFAVGSAFTSGCTALNVVEFPNIITLSSTANVSVLQSGKKIIIGPNCTSMTGRLFQNNEDLEAFICKATTPPTITSTIFGSNTNLQSIYVPDASVNDYKGANNWSAYASIIKPLSDYTE